VRQLESFDVICLAEKTGLSFAMHVAATLVELQWQLQLQLQRKQLRLKWRKRVQGGDEAAPDRFNFLGPTAATQRCEFERSMLISGQSSE
jgi:hypothetical protein